MSGSRYDRFPLSQPAPVTENSEKNVENNKTAKGSGRKKITYDERQIQLLEQAFQQSHYLKDATKYLLVEKLGTNSLGQTVELKNVQTWFAYQRNKLRRSVS